VEDDGAGLQDPGPSEGIGLGNTRKRLETLYGPGASVQVRDHPRGGAIVTVTIPLHVAP
jgi:two-component system, LytTR family, sensor kinase